MDKIEANLTEAERLVYREEKAVNGLFRAATGEDEALSRAATQTLRKFFYEKKRALEVLQGQEKKNYAELGRLTNLCKNIVALFNDMGLGLHERTSTSPRPSSGIVRGDTSVIMGPSNGKKVQEQHQQPKLPARMYRGLTEENT